MVVLFYKNSQRPLVVNSSRKKAPSCEVVPPESTITENGQGCTHLSEKRCDLKNHHQK